MQRIANSLTSLLRRIKIAKDKFKGNEPLQLYKFMLSENGNSRLVNIKAYTLEMAEEMM